MPEEWKQERPERCPHDDCNSLFKRRVEDKICGCTLLVPQEHEGDKNPYRICLNFDTEVIDIKINDTDTERFRWVFDALDGKKTSWLSKR